MPPERRSLGVVFQDALLFPHLSVLDNVGAGLRFTGASRMIARARAREWLERIGIGELAAAMPAALSGGQAQRVALARALATEPRVLLLDEPLSALDVTTRAEIRRELRRHLASFAGIRLLVTHDPIDALALADRLVVLEHGRVVQSGSSLEVTARPRSRYVADFVGVNWLRGRPAATRSRSRPAARSSSPTSPPGTCSSSSIRAPSPSIAPSPRAARGTCCAERSSRPTTRARACASASRCRSRWSPRSRARAAAELELDRGGERLGHRQGDRDRDVLGVSAP